MQVSLYDTFIDIGMQLDEDKKYILLVISF